MTSNPWDTTAAWGELLEGLAHLDSAFLDGPRAVDGEEAIVEGYRFLATMLGVAFDTYLFNDPTRPVLLDVNTPARPDRRWGGDNTDAYYSFTPIDPIRTYRVTGQRGDSDYFSLTVYNEPSPGEWSTRVVGIVNDDDLDIDDAGEFSFLVGPTRPDGYDGAFIELTSDASIAFTRDYQADPDTGRRVEWHIESLDPPGPLARSDRDTAAALRAALKWINTMFQIVPMTLAPRDADIALGHNTPTLANEFAEPYQVQDVNYGWSARDACYAFGSFTLAPDEALVITHTPPPCRFWNIVVWNQFMATNHQPDARAAINGRVAKPNSDGSVTVVVSRLPLEHPNSITTVDHAEGALAFRWFLTENVPVRPTVKLVRLNDAPTRTD